MTILSLFLHIKLIKKVQTTHKYRTNNEQPPQITIIDNSTGY